MTRLNIPLFVALAVSILSAVPADAGANTLPHQRMIRKRGPAVIGRVEAFDHGLYIRQGPGSTTSVAAGGSSTAPASSTAAAPSTTQESSTSVAATPTTTSTSTTTSAASSTAAASTSSGLLDSLTGLLGSSSTVASTTSTTSTSTSTSTTPTSTSTTAAAPQTTQQAAPATTATPTLNLASAASTSARAGGTTVIMTTTAAAEASASASAAAKKTATITRNTIISLVVVASCIGGAIAIWTVIRKWKLSPSEKFDDRMQPIDWAPPVAGGAHEETIEEKRHRRAGSTGSHGSFTSGGVGQSENGHGKYNASQQGHGYGMQSQDFPPPHDFTAGAAQPGYGQYYGGQQYAGGAPGYADLQRGPSMSESTYSHGASVTRGLSYSRGPTAGYEAQPGAAGVPPLPNPYGGEYGYDDYGHGQPAAQPQQPQGQGQYRGF